jgi:hypothetical protein
MKRHPASHRARNVELTVVSIASVETTGLALRTSVPGACYAWAHGMDRDLVRGRAMLRCVVRPRTRSHEPRYCGDRAA